MRFVRQRTGCDCAVACLAMVSGESYEAVMTNLSDRAKNDIATDKGLYYSDDLDFLWSLGFDPTWEVLHSGWSPDCERAILTVPSKNREGKLHAVAWNGESIMDPARDQKYETQEALKKAIFVIRITR